MTSPSEYQGILFPSRAEAISSGNFSSYRVFLNFWQPLADQLRAFFEKVKIRNECQILLVHGPQGGGKSMFARKLSTDFNYTQSFPASDASADNLWHQVSGGTTSGKARLDSALISAASAVTSMIIVSDDPTAGTDVIKDDKDWLNGVIQRVKGNGTRRWIIVLDNAERGYFMQSLLNASDTEFVSLVNDVNATNLAAVRFVGYARTQLRGCLFVVLTNNETFASTVAGAINAQHNGLLVRTNLPLPGATEKETVVRVNINRLNSISYWYCLDRAGPTEKAAVYAALNGAETFPGSFAAVDEAIRSSDRVGRRAKTCLLTLIVLTPSVDADELAKLGKVWRDEVTHKWLSVVNFESEWASDLLPTRDAGLLESEWTLRVVALGDQFTQSLISGDPVHELACQNLLNRLKKSYGPGIHQTTLDENRVNLEKLVDAWPTTAVNSTSSFWTVGQRRSTTYEPILTRLLPGYNQISTGFLSCRPDFIVEAFRPCSVLGASSSDVSDINKEIRRSAHVYEFTTVEQFTALRIRTYLQTKLGNYVLVTQEQ